MGETVYWQEEIWFWEAGLRHEAEQEMRRLVDSANGGSRTLVHGQQNFRFEIENQGENRSRRDQFPVQFRGFYHVPDLNGTLSI